VLHYGDKPLSSVEHAPLGLLFHARCGAGANTLLGVSDCSLKGRNFVGAMSPARTVVRPGDRSCSYNATQISYKETPHERLGSKT
jgi:hypothetical protein